MIDTTNAPAPLTLEEKIAKSSQVAVLLYDETTRKLTVEFKSGKGGTPAEHRYVYDDFPAEKYAELITAESLGSYLYRNVTGGKGRSTPYSFTKIDRLTGEIAAVVKADAA